MALEIIKFFSVIVLSPFLKLSITYEVYRYKLHVFNEKTKSLCDFLVDIRYLEINSVRRNPSHIRATIS